MAEIVTTDSDFVVRVARKEHICRGDYDVENRKRISCARGPIKKGERYVEDVTANGPFQSGNRYHAECAIHQGIAKATAERG